MKRYIDHFSPWLMSNDSKQPFIVAGPEGCGKQYVFIILNFGKLEIMKRVRKMLKRALAHENFLKMQLRINRPEKKGTFFLKVRKVASDIFTSNKVRLGPASDAETIRSGTSVWLGAIVNPNPHRPYSNCVFSQIPIFSTYVLSFGSVLNEFLIQQ